MIDAWVLQDSVTGQFYADAGLQLGPLNNAVILRTEESVLNGISKRKTMMRRDIKLQTIIKEINWSDYAAKGYKNRIKFAKKRANLFDFGIQAVKLNISI